MLASIGHHTGVAMVFGIKFSDFIAWWMWRTINLLKTSEPRQEAAGDGGLDTGSVVR
jgi:NADH dehydrogenase FAD-containing subunit